MKIAAGADACLGNPDFSRPLAVCFNGSTQALANQFDEIRPTSYDSKIGIPDFLSGNAIIGGDCYVLPTSALCDYAEYRFYIVLDAKSGENPTPGTNEQANAILLDKTYYKDDDGNWKTDWGYDSDITTDSDIGMVSETANTKAIYFT